jgi:hypothetical protein
MRIRPEFLRALGRTVDLARLEDSHHSIFGLTPELRLAYYNPAWLEHAAMGGAPRFAESWPLGRAVLAAVPTVLRSFYLEGYGAALAGGRPWEAEYLSPTPYRLKRHLMRVVPLPARAGLLVFNLQIADEPQQGGQPADERRFRHADGRLRQCASCRGFAPQAQPTQWLLVPSWLVLPPPRVTTLLCPPCAERHRPRVALAA